MHPLYTQFQHSLLGRLKTIELSLLSGSLEKFPSQRKVLSSIMDRWRRNSEYGRFLFNLIYEYNSRIVEVPSKMSVRHADLVLKTLAHKSQITRLFVEERSGACEMPRGALILGHKRYDDSIGYYAMIQQESTYPQAVIISIAPTNDRHTRIQIMTREGWQNISLKQAIVIFEVRMVISALWNYLTVQNIKSFHLSDLLADPRIASVYDADSNSAPPLDDEFMRNIRLVIRGKLSVSLVRTSSRNVRPYDLDHCFKLEANIIEQFIPHVDTENPLSLVVYWDGTDFVMSDDYYAYAAYKKLARSEIRLAVLGDCPTHNTCIEKVGGIELLPPFIILPKPVANSTPEFRNWLLDQRLRKKAALEVPATLAATWLVFADMLGHKSTTERHLHDFIRDHPATISAYATRVESEVRLGNQFRIDLLIRASGVREEVTLVELEHHRHTLFTADGRPSYKVTHSCQQVKDWFQWLGENPDDPLARSLGGIKPSGLVIIGRSAAFSDKDRRLLANHNENSSVQVITYDEVLDRFRDLILSQSDNEE